MERAIELEHFARVVYDTGPAGHGCRAECDCGWHSDSYGDDDAAADLAAIVHREIAAGTGDGLDGFIGELLDLQDDLAGLVCWLAEHWTANLPVPLYVGCDPGPETDAPTAVVMVPCPGVGVLGRVAELLGTVITTVSLPPCDVGDVLIGRGLGRLRAVDGRYSLAHRRLGRVVVEAWDVEP